MQLFLNQPFTPQGNVDKSATVLSQKAVGTNSTTVHIYTVQGKTFQYKVYTDANDNITKVVALSPRQLAPVSYFIQNVNTCTKKLVMRVPLRMAVYEYTCPTGTYKYTTFGVIGHLITTAEVVR
jgi:hypothetical protein